MKIQNLLVILFAMIIVLILFGSNEIQADPDEDDDDDNNYGPCRGSDWDDVWWGVRMMLMMSIGILAIIIFLAFIIRNESFLSPPSNNAVSYQSPSPNNSVSSQLDQRYARGEISREEYISQSLDNFINRFSDEE